MTFIRVNLITDRTSYTCGPLKRGPSDRVQVPNMVLNTYPYDLGNLSEPTGRGTSRKQLDVRLSIFEVS